MNRTLAVLALSLLCFDVHPVAAQQPGRVQTSDPRLMQNADPQSDNVISIDFAGGTVAQYIAALKKAANGKPVNIIASERAAKQQLSAISLKDVTVSVAAFSIQSAAVSPGGAWLIEQVRAPGGNFIPAEALSATFRVDYNPLSTGRPNDEVAVETFSLQRILHPVVGTAKDDSGKVVLTAIETGLKLKGPDGPDAPELKFHADSGLLFVKGSMAELRLVSQIVSRMSDDAERLQTVAERRAKEERLKTIATKEAEMEIQLREMEAQVADKTYQDVEQQVNAGVASKGELLHLSLERGRARVNLERAKLNLERAQLMLPKEVADDGDIAPEAKKAIQDLQSENAKLRAQMNDFYNKLQKAESKSPAPSPK